MGDLSALLPHHIEQLKQGSGISPEVIATRGYGSIHGPEAYSELKHLGFSRAQAKLRPGILVLILNHHGKPVL